MFNTNNIPALDSAACAQLLGTRSEMRLAHNTTLRRIGDTFAVRLHSTDIITFVGDVAVVNTSGWWSVTTFQRLSKILPGASVGSRGWFGRRFVTPDMGANARSEWSHPFADGQMYNTRTRSLELQTVPADVMQWIREGRGRRSLSITDRQAAWVDTQTFEPLAA